MLEIVDIINRQNNVAKNVGMKQWNHIRFEMQRAYQMCTNSHLMSFLQLMGQLLIQRDSVKDPLKSISQKCMFWASELHLQILSGSNKTMDKGLDLQSHPQNYSLKQCFENAGLWAKYYEHVLLVYRGIKTDVISKKVRELCKQFKNLQSLK